MVSGTIQQTGATGRPSFTLQGRLRAAREDNRMTQEEVAKAMGWRQSRVSKIETGEYRRPQFDDVVRLARLYKREIEYFSVVVE